VPFCCWVTWKAELNSQLKEMSSPLDSSLAGPLKRAFDCSFVKKALVGFRCWWEGSTYWQIELSLMGERDFLRVGSRERSWPFVLMRGILNCFLL